MIAAMRPDLDNIDEYVRNTTARAFSVVASALGIPALLPFLKAVCQSKKSWQARHTGIKIVQQIAILMGCAVLPHLKALVDIVKHGGRGGGWWGRGGGPWGVWGCGVEVGVGGWGGAPFHSHLKLWITRHRVQHMLPAHTLGSKANLCHPLPPSLPSSPPSPSQAWWTRTKR